MPFCKNKSHLGNIPQKSPRKIRKMSTPTMSAHHPRERAAAQQKHHRQKNVVFFGSLSSSSTSKVLLDDDDCVGRGRRGRRNQSVSSLSVRSEETLLLEKKKKKKNESKKKNEKEEETKKTEREQATFMTHLVAGFCGGALSRTVTSPLNVVQVRKMTNQLTNQCKLVPSLVKIAKNEGIKALFAGNATMMLRYGPSKGLNFATFHFFNSNLHAFVEKRREKKRATETFTTTSSGGNHNNRRRKRKEEVEVEKKKDSEISIKMLAGALCGVSACLLLYPLDAYATRKAAGKISENFTGPFSVGLGIHHVVKNEGFGGLMRGLTPALLAIAPEAALTFGTYDIIAEWYKDTFNKEYVEPHVSMCVGAISATTGQLAAFPMELIARKAATNRFSLTFHDTFWLMAMNRGIGSLYKGAKVAATRCMPMSAVSFATYEIVKHLILSCDNPIVESVFKAPQVSE